MRKALLPILLLLTACGEKPTPPAPAAVAEEAPEVVTLSGVEGADDWRDCLGQLVSRFPDGSVRVGASGHAIGTVTRWLAPGKVEVEKPLGPPK
jgi:hypothetical protein